MISPMTSLRRQRGDFRRQSGFTLLEVLVAMTVTTLILVGALTALDNTRRIARNGMTISEAQQTSSYAMQELAENVRKAGLNLGKRNAIVTAVKTGTTVYTLTWDNYSAASYPNGIWNDGPSKVFLPVTGTDGMTVRYTDGKPPVHLCIMPSANANTFYLGWNPSLDGFYPRAGDTIELLTSSPCVDPNIPGGTGAGTDPYVISLTLNNQTGPDPNNPATTTAGNCNCSGSNCSAAPLSCTGNDPVCADLYTNNKNGGCVHYTLTNTAPNCDFCQVGPTYIMSSITQSYWISTEDGTGVVYSSPGVVSSRPVLVSRTGYTGTTRILSENVEDLQVTYMLDGGDTTYTTGAGVNPVIPPDAVNGLTRRPDASVVATNFMPDQIQMAAVRAVQIELSTRTASTDLISKSRTYCANSLPAASRPLFSRATQGNHPIAPADNDYCDGYKRQLSRQVVFLSNMLAKPLS